MDTSAGQIATAPTDRRPTPDFSDQKKASRAYGSIVLPAVLLWVAIVLSIVFFLVCLFHSRHWPILHDAAIMHYVVFLMDHGMLPYKDVIDINMPGAYMAEWFAIHVFGSGPLGWRGYDAFTMLIVLVSAAVIAPRGDRAAGLFGGLGACAFHLANEADRCRATRLDHHGATVLDGRVPAGMLATRKALDVIPVGSMLRVCRDDQATGNPISRRIPASRLLGTAQIQAEK